MPTEAQPYATCTDFDSAVALAQRAAAAYYNSDALLMTDSEYDTLLDRIAASTHLHPDWDAAGLLTEVAGGTANGADIQHPEPMLSLVKATEAGDLETFLARLAGRETVTEVKLDGMAVRAAYVDGALVQVVTRGDGLSGEDVTPQALAVAGLPAALNTPVSLEVRGEVFMTDADFTTASANRVEAGKTAFVNPRNATAGTLRNTDLAYVAPLSFAAYDSSGPAVDNFDRHTERMARLQHLGIATAISLLPQVDPTDGAREVVSAIGELRAELGFPIDGAVIKIDEIPAREGFGSVSHAPKWAIAWKYPADAAQSVLRDIEVTIGRTGRMALTAIIDPVFVAGATVSRATLHNVDFVRTQRLGIGSQVAVVRANDVIPRVTALLGEQQSVEPWQPPSACPNCDEAWDTSEVLWRCHSASCSVAAALTYWASRDCLDVERLGEAVCDALVQEGRVASVADLYDLTVADLAALPLGERTLGEANAREIIAGLERSKSQSFNRVITGLGIRYTGRSVGRWLAAEFHTMQRLRAATVEQIASIDKLGPVKAQHIVDGLSTLGPVIDRLEAAGVNMGAEPASSDAAQLPLAGKTYVVSGAVPGFTRTTIAEAIERLGGKANSSVSKTTTALISSETDTSKAKKARDMGIPVVDPVEFAALLRMHA
jgi:DNA ligase (NAD+)